MGVSQQERASRIFVTQLSACCDRAPSFTASLHFSILQPTEVQHVAWCLSISAVPLLGYFLNWCFQEAVFSFLIITVTPVFKTYHATVTQHPILLPSSSLSSEPATLLSRRANIAILLPAGGQGTGVLLGPSTLLPFLFRSLRSAVDTGTRRSFYSNKGFYCPCSLCASLSLTTGENHSTKDAQKNKSKNLFQVHQYFYIILS